MSGTIDTPNEGKFGQILANRWIWFAVIVVAFLIALAQFFGFGWPSYGPLSQPPN
jgi:hypothetical protein